MQPGAAAMTRGDNRISLFMKQWRDVLVALSYVCPLYQYKCAWHRPRSGRVMYEMSGAAAACSMRREVVSWKWARCALSIVKLLRARRVTAPVTAKYNRQKLASRKYSLPYRCTSNETLVSSSKQAYINNRHGCRNRS